MRTLRPLGALALVLGAFSACQQVDQRLPFELDEGGQTTIGNSGGIISLPPNFSLQVPAGALTTNTTVTAAERLTAFPTTAGVVVSGLMFDVGPNGTQLSAPATVQIAVDPAILQVGDLLSLSVALLTQGGTVVVPTATYDLTSGLLTAEIDELGAVAAVVSTDAIPLGLLDSIVSLGGGSISPAPTPVGPAALPPTYGGAYFAASCSTNAQQCFSSGIVELWADSTVYEHLGQDIALVNASVSGSIEFFNFIGNVPTQVIAELVVGGELRTRLNSVVVGRRLADEIRFHTGSGSTPAPTTVTFGGSGANSTMTLAQTSDDSPEVVRYGITGIGTGEQLTIRLEGELEFTDSNGNPEFGTIVAHVRLRR